MGIDTFFDGGFTITPPVSEAVRDAINRQDNNLDTEFDPWEISDEGDAISTPPEGRRAYDADEHLAFLVGELTDAGHAVEGTCLAVNEEDVRWKYVVTGGEIHIYAGFTAYEDGTAEHPDWECRRKGAA